MKRSFGTAILAAAVGMGTLFGGIAGRAEAESVSSLKGEQGKIQDQRSNVQSDINDAKTKMNAIQGIQDDVQSEMKRLDFAISDTNDKIQQETAKVEETKGQVAKLQNDIKVIQERIAKRNQLLKERVRSYQETGGMVSYIDVLMGAKSFSDFIDRANAVATIMEADQDIIKQAKTDENELKEKQDQVEKDLASLQTMLDDLQKMNQQLNSQREEKNSLLAQLEQQKNEVQEGMLEKVEQDKILASQEDAIKKAIQVEQEKQAAAAAAAAAAAQAAKNNTTSGAASTPTPPVSSGSWTRPAAGIITSNFGERDDFRSGDYHIGLDIANSGSNVPIVAAADGVVLQASYSNGYGNYVILVHSINGQIYSTVYAHQQRYLVSDGQVVSKGQQIGIMGSTGDSTGQHLHFELHVGRWTDYNSMRSNAINPMSVIPF